MRDLNSTEVVTISSNRRKTMILLVLLMSVWVFAPEIQGGLNGFFDSMVEHQ